MSAPPAKKAVRGSQPPYHQPAPPPSVLPHVLSCLSAAPRSPSVCCSQRLSGTPLTPGHAPLPEGVGVDMFSLKGKVALVTGSSKGLGKGMAIGLAQAGAHVLINSRNKSECQAVVEEIKALGCQASEASFDVVDEASVATNVQALAEAHGGIHILVNNAGGVHISPLSLSPSLPLSRSHAPGKLTSAPPTPPAGTRRSPFLESTSEDLDFVINLNLRGPYFMARECGKVMKKLGGGKIINIGSLMCVLGRKTIQPYNATKFAINGLTRGLACELGPHNIQVCRVPVWGGAAWGCCDAPSSHASTASAPACR
jgi:gluconate 5-dehydrogenase